MADLNGPIDVTELLNRLEEAESTLSAIRNGEVDALVVGGKEIYTLAGADHPYRVLVEAMQQGAVTVSPDGAVVYCNSGFSQMVKRPTERILGLPIDSLFSPEDRPALRQRLAQGPGAKQAELTLQASDESRLPVLVSFSLLHLDGVEAICLVITDLTEHRQNQRLQDTDRRKDEFLAMLAHELRNPLAPIANAVELLIASNSDDEQVRWACDLVGRQVRHMTRIVDDLLDVSRITRRKIKLERLPVEISTIISAAVETSRPLIESRKHTLHIMLAPESLKINVDATRIAQVVTNLLNNAAKYTEEGGQIWLVVARDGDAVTVSVRDNGVGVSPDLLSTVFDLFTQADRTIDRSQGGLGVGLTLVRSLVELHDGSVSASSAGLGLGSEFVIRLPLHVAPTMNRDTIDATDGVRHSHDSSQRILVVDDNADAANSLALALEVLGHRTAVAYDGPSAIEQAEVFSPTVILLDIGLPKMNGYAVAAEIQSRPAMKGVVLVALTGYGEEQDRARSQATGFNEHFVKPLDFTVLRKFLTSLSNRLPVGG